MLKRYLKQIFTSLFNSQAAEMTRNEKKIDKQLARLKQMQRTNPYKPRPRKKETSL
jgi:hypothetical protein